MMQLMGWAAKTQKESTMSIAGMIIMWVLVAVVFAILNNWPMGKTYDHRAEYWARFEGR